MCIHTHVQNMCTYTDTEVEKEKSIRWYVLNKSEAFSGTLG